MSCLNAVIVCINSYIGCLTAVLVFAAIGRRDRLDQENRARRPRGPKNPDNAKKGPRKAQGRSRGRPKENTGIKDMGKGQEGSRHALVLS